MNREKEISDEIVDWLVSDKGFMKEIEKLENSAEKCE